MSVSRIHHIDFPVVFEDTGDKGKISSVSALWRNVFLCYEYFHRGGNTLSLLGVSGDQYHPLDTSY